MRATSKQHPKHASCQRWVGMGVGVLLLIGSLGIYNTVSARPVLFRITHHSVLYVPLGWQVYRDPAGTFSTELPGDWHGSVASADAAATESSYIIHPLWPDPQQTVFRPNNLHGFIAVNRYPIRSEVERALVCQVTALWPRNRTIAGVPATDDDGAVIVITNGAMYEISTKFYTTRGQRQPVAYPENGTVYQQIAASFALEDTTPLVC